MSIIGNMEKRAAKGPADDFWYQPGGFFYGGTGIKTKSGASISEMNAMQLSVVWCCIKVLAEDSASLPLHLYRRRKGGGKDKAWSDDRYSLLHDRPNPEMTAMSFREAFAAHLLAWGNAYAEIERTGGRIKKPVAIWPITPNRVKVKRDSNRKIVYQVSMAGSGLPDVTLPKENTLHTPGLSFNGLIGYSPIAAAREAMGLGKTLEEYGASYFENGIHPSL
ncbi:MAG: phage portal protein, partial [Syntrophaceae bacterium]